MKKILLTFVFFLFFLPHAVLAQKKRDDSFKILATMTGLGASYEWNPSGIVYVEGGVTTSFNTYRFNIQSKLSLYKEENFKIKLGVEGAYIVGNFDVGGIYIDYNRFNNFVFMPMVSFEGRVLGIQLPVFVDRSFSYIFPIVGITLNVSKDKPANRTIKDKSRKDFEREAREREKYREKQEKKKEEEEEND
ncbi:MAG: hypothetical protein H0X62_17520 [Bacteroidetes bacterium]|nr:hypothetical protein [Bacteroidota bacterium]